MFLNKTVQRNPDLIRYAALLHRSGRILPDTYVVDLDAVIHNAAHMLAEADRLGIRLFFMTKQFGRNPLVSRELMKLGYEGAVAVDYKEALLLHDAGIPLGHVGHLVQIPSALVESAVRMKPAFITVFSVEKAVEINEACRKNGLRQNVMLRITDQGDVIYPAQSGGFRLEELEDRLPELLRLDHVTVAGITSFPCFLYNKERGEIEPTNNAATLKRAARLLEEQFGLAIKHVNMPSANCTHSLGDVRRLGGTQAEPGHGLLGSTPMHADRDLIERPAMVYVSEISHRANGNSFCYGGGLYQRSQVDRALVVPPGEADRYGKVLMPDSYAIDYHIELEGRFPVGSSVIMAFRTQVFVTRSEVAVVKGLSRGEPELAGIFDSLGRPLREIG